MAISRKTKIFGVSITIAVIIAVVCLILFIIWMVKNSRLQDQDLKEKISLPLANITSPTTNKVCTNLVIGRDGKCQILIVKWKLMNGDSNGHTYQYRLTQLYKHSLGDSYNTTYTSYLSNVSEALVPICGTGDYIFIIGTEAIIGNEYKQGNTVSVCYD